MQTRVFGLVALQRNLVQNLHIFTFVFYFARRENPELSTFGVIVFQIDLNRKYETEVIRDARDRSVRSNVSSENQFESNLHLVSLCLTQVNCADVDVLPAEAMPKLKKMDAHSSLQKARLVWTCL